MLARKPDSPPPDSPAGRGSPRSRRRRLTRALRGVSWKLAIVGLAAAPADAQSDAASGKRSDGDDRIEELEARNRELEKRIESLESRVVLVEDASPGPDDEGYGLGLEGDYGDVHATFQIFGDVGFGVRNPEPDGEGHSAFTLGSVDFFTNAQLGERFRILSETVVEESRIGQERLWASWTFSDAFRAKLGTEHVPLSRWNQLYHHGRWLETTIDRPTAVQFEGGSGILPMHRTGLELSGSLLTDVGRFVYFGTVSNGRGASPKDKQRRIDLNEGKAIDAGIAFEPTGAANLRVGIAGTLDRIPEDAGSADPLRADSIHERIATAHLSFEAGPIDCLAEIAYIAHEVQADQRDFSHHTGYLQLAYDAGDWTPYTRFDYRDMEPGDPFYRPLDRDLDQWMQTLGIRRELTGNLAFKIEVGYGRVEERGGAGISERDLARAALQVSWWL